MKKKIKGSTGRGKEGYRPKYRMGWKKRKKEERILNRKGESE